MKQAYVIAIVIALCVGVYFLGEGITGFTMQSQSCCFGEDCSLENRCQNQPIEESPAQLSPREDFTLALTIILVSVIIFVNLYQKKKQHLHKQLDLKHSSR